MKNVNFVSRTFLAVGFVLAANLVNAQEASPGFKPAVDNAHYRTAIGVRAGGTSGLTIKHFTGNFNAIEGIIGFYPNALSLTALYEKHAGGSTPGLHWYYGGGGHVAIESGRFYSISDGRRWRRYYSNGEVALGVDGILGVEYKIPPIPFAISLDVKPFVEVNTDGGAYLGLDPGLGIKVTF